MQLINIFYNNKIIVLDNIKNSNPGEQFITTRLGIFIVEGFFVFHGFLEELIFFFFYLVQVQSLRIQQRRLQWFIQFEYPELNKNNLIWIYLSSFEHLYLFDSTFVLSSFIGIYILIKILNF
ncbi:unnamed protein product [Paramecium sonneborni]|uniref:Uncharacterized protein n=1 Tax=Paramecium sonneborni TaxID=65129 RepID=A0A8S1QM69_9CILI|nr:unnamed protein product [Paramecium sonneborni]